MAFFRKWKLYTKHKKLSEDWGLAASLKDVGENGEDEQNPTTTFNLKYLGSMEIASEKSKTATAEAVKTIMSTEKKSRRKAQRVNLTVSPRGIEIFDPTSGNNILRVSIYKISYCSADAAHDHVFAFIGSPEHATIDEFAANASTATSGGGANSTAASINGSNSKKAAAAAAAIADTLPEKSVSVSKEKENNGTGSANADKLTCYIFLCPKRRIAHDVTLTVAHCFENAYQMWRLTVERKMLMTNKGGENKDNAATVQQKQQQPNGTNSDAMKKEEPIKDLLIDFTPDDDIQSDPFDSNFDFEFDQREYLKNTWVAFDDDQPKDNSADRFCNPSPWEQPLVC